MRRTIVPDTHRIDESPFLVRTRYIGQRKFDGLTHLVQEPFRLMHVDTVAYLVCLSDDPRWSVGYSEIQYLALNHEIVEALHHFRNAGTEVPPVDLSSTNNSVHLYCKQKAYAMLASRIHMEATHGACSMRKKLYSHIVYQYNRSAIFEGSP